MTNYTYWAEDSSEALEHHGILGMKWGKRRYQYEDGSLTPEGRKRYLKGDGSLTRAGQKEIARRNKILERGQAIDLSQKWYNSRIYGRDVIKEGLTDEQFNKFIEASHNGDTSTYKEYSNMGLQNYIRRYYKTAVDDIHDTSYKKYEDLFRHNPHMYNDPEFYQWRHVLDTTLDNV